MTMIGYDTIVVGGGSAGCVLAARLSEDPDRRVLLLEAGPDYPRLDQLPADLADGSDAVGDSHDWGFLGEPRPGAEPIRLLRGKVMGGSSAVNACWALRGSPADYAGWNLPGWSFGEILPYFRTCEADADFGADPWHSSSGMVPIRRYRDDEMTALGRALIDTAVGLGHHPVDDHNRPGAVGAGKAPLSIADNIRQNTALTYLAAARDRANLTIRSGVLVDRVEIDQGRATGVWLADPAQLIEADSVILAAGTYASPAILLRSGIGPAADLAALGIDVVLDLPGVGGNLHDHPRIGLELVGFPGMALVPKFPSVVTVHSAGADLAGPPDLHLGAGGAWQDPAGSLFFVFTALLKPRSRGQLTLRSADPTDPPSINLGLLTDPADQPPMRDGIRHLLGTIATPPLADLVAKPPGAAPGPATLDDDREIDAWARANARTYHHPVGTCRMGEPGQGAVVTAKGAVHGIDRLWVADASIMPEIPSANTNLPTIMLAERISAWLTGRTTGE
jgi:choline dehydrogenase